MVLVARDPLVVVDALVVVDVLVVKEEVGLVTCLLVVVEEVDVTGLLVFGATVAALVVVVDLVGRVDVGKSEHIV